jgi:alcohol dehydrogenase class IV
LAEPSADRFLGWLRALKEDIGIPATLGAHGLDAGLAPRLTELATADACHANNPRRVTSDDFAAIFEAAYG